MSPMTNMADVQAGLERSKRPCQHCGKVMRRPNLVSHEPACSPERREERRLRYMLHAREVRSRPGFVRRPDPTDECECGRVKKIAAKRCAYCHNHRPRVRRPVEDRFWEKVDQSGGPDACWPWLAARNGLGYGAFGVTPYQIETASRVAWTLTNGSIPVGLEVCHSCDFPPCVNPAHLWLGTHADNMGDMARKGRARCQKAGAA